MSIQENIYIIHLTPYSIRLLDPELVETLTFQDEVIKDKKIIDKLKFKLEVEKLFQQTGLKDKQGLVILSKELYFNRGINVNRPEEVHTEYEEFLDELPFEKEDLATLRVYGQKSLEVLAVEKDLFLILEEVGKKFGWEISGVLPLSLIEDLNNIEEPSGEEISSALKSLESLRKINFLTPIPAVQVFNNQTSPKKKFPIRAILLFFLMMGVGFLLFNFKNSLTQLPTVFKSFLIPVPVSVTPTPTIMLEPTPSPTPTPSFLSKTEIKIQILNASGITGQAGKLKTELTKIEFTNIETGNAKQRETGESVVKFSPKVSEEVRQEVLTQLKETLTEVVSEESSELQESDILITIKR